MRYWVQPKDWVFVKGYGFLSFTIERIKTLVKIWVKTKVADNTARNFLIMLNNVQQMHLKIIQIE